MKKFKIFLDKDLEAEWLNKLADQGYQMIRFNAGMYEFEERDPGKYLYHVDLIDRVNFDLEAYKGPLKTVGIEVITQFGNYVYLRKLKENGPFKMGRSVEDQIAQYNRIGLMFIAMMFVEFIVGIMALISGIFAHNLMPMFVGIILFIVGVCFLRNVIRIGKKVNKLSGR